MHYMQWRGALERSLYHTHTHTQWLWFEHNDLSPWTVHFVRLSTSICHQLLAIFCHCSSRLSSIGINQCKQQFNSINANVWTQTNLHTLTEAKRLIELRRLRKFAICNGKWQSVQWHEQSKWDTSHLIMARTFCCLIRDHRANFYAYWYWFSHE